MGSLAKPKRLIVLVMPGDGTDEYPYIPFPVMFLASYLEEAGYDVTIIDQQIERNWKARLDEIIDEILWVGFSVITAPTINEALEVSRYVKKARNDIPIVWGGWHPTFVPDQTIAHPDVDYIVTGVGEQKIVDLSRYFESGAKGNLNIEGVLQKERGGIKTPWKEKPPNMRIMPAYHLVDVDEGGGALLDTSDQVVRSDRKSPR